MGGSKTLGPSNQITVVDAEGRADASDVNEMFDEISLEYQAHTHGLVGCVGHDALVGDQRWKHNDSESDWALVCGSALLVMEGGKAQLSVTFADDAEQGDPMFTAQPTIGIIAVCGPDELAVFTLLSRTAVGFVALAWERTGTIGTFTAMWWAFGKVS